MAIKGGNIEKGMYLLYKNEPHLVLERNFVSPGKGSAFSRVKFKNAKSGSVFKDVIVKASESLEEAEVSEVKTQYLYFENESYFFMDLDTR